MLLRLLPLVWPLVALIGPAFAAGQQPERQPQDASEAVDLAVNQGRLADKYKRLESLMLKMAEFDASDNPSRSALLKQALARAKERHIGRQMDTIVQLFQQEQLQLALENQQSLRTDLQALLELLLTENRPDRLQNEQARLRRYLKELDRIIRIQKSIQGRTEGGDASRELAQDQERAADRTESLGAEIDQTETASGTASDQSPTPSKSSGDASKTPADGQDEAPSNQEDSGAPGDDDEAQTPNGQQQPGQQQPGQQQPGQQQPGQQQPGQQQPGQQQPGQQQPGQQQPGQQQPGQQQPESFPGRERIEAAEQAMRDAQQQLEEEERQAAVQQQEQARSLLEQAKAELEEILRQKREEEIERVLAMLESRFRKMLERQLKVNEATVRLDRTDPARRSRQFAIRTSKLSLEELGIVQDVDKALNLLREEGSSVAFPEAVSQMRTDMEQVATWLQEQKVGLVTQALEEEIVAALQEIVAALQKAQREAEERRNQPPPPPGSGEPADQPLVDAIAELRMIRTLQMRVNKRTERYAQLLEDANDVVGQAKQDELVAQLRELARRQDRIHRITQDIVLGKNE